MVLGSIWTRLVSAWSATGATIRNEWPPVVRLHADALSAYWLPGRNGNTTTRNLRALCPKSQGPGNEPPQREPSSLLIENRGLDDWSRNQNDFSSVAVDSCSMNTTRTTALQPCRSPLPHLTRALGTCAPPTPVAVILLTCSNKNVIESLMSPKGPQSKISEPEERRRCLGV